MKVLEVGKLRAGERLLFPCCHESGRILLPAGSLLEDVHLAGFVEAGIGRLFECETDSEMRALRHIAGRTALELDEMPLDGPLPSPLYDREGNMLLKEGTILQRALVDRLIERGVTTVYLEPYQASVATEPIGRFRAAVLRERARSLDARANGGMSLVVTPAGNRFRSRQIRPERLYAAEEKEACLAARRSAVAAVDEIFRVSAQGAGVPERAATACLDTLVHCFTAAPNLLECMSYLERKGDFLAEHAVSTSATAMAIAEALDLGSDQVREVTLAALLANVGMVRVPDEIVKKPGRLTADEMREIHRHTIHGINLLEQIPGIPETVRLAVYQSHEREDGSGYPRRRRHLQIHDYARILTVADMFAAMSSVRPHRPAMLPYEAIETIIRLAGGKVLCQATVRALLRAVSLYPIGSWVEISTGERARVIAATGARPIDRPIVRILADSGGRPIEPRILDLATESSVRVVRAIPAPLDPADRTIGF